METIAVKVDDRFLEWWKTLKPKTQDNPKMFMLAWTAWRTALKTNLEEEKGD